MRPNKLLLFFFIIVFCSTANAGFLAVGIKNPASHSTDCVGWNCGILLDSNAQSWYFFTGYTGFDNKGTFHLTNSGVGLDSTDYIAGINSGNFEADEFDRLTKTGTTSDWNWASTNALSITFWFKTESVLPSNTPFFVKGITASTQCIDIEQAYSHLMRLRVDGNGDGTWENYIFSNAYTDNQWYFFAVTINASTGAYYATLWGQTESATIDTISGTLTNGISNLNDTGTTYIGNNSGAVYFDGHIDEITVWNKVLNTTEISEIRQGIFK